MIADFSDDIHLKKKKSFVPLLVETIHVHTIGIYWESITFDAFELEGLQRDVEIGRCLI
jgi:hypothetical protein